MTIPYFFTTLLLACFVVAGPAPMAHAGTVLTSIPAVQAMAEVLTEGTTVKPVLAVPEGYSMAGHEAYLKKHGKPFSLLARDADAVLSVGGAWADDPLYPWARRANIRIVNIDVVTPLDRARAGVPLIRAEASPLPHVWRSPANLTRMASVAADELSRLYPSQRAQIMDNLQRLQAELFSLRSRYSMDFSMVEQVDLAALASDFAYLLNEFGLPVHFHYTKPEHAWTADDVTGLAHRLKKKGIVGVVLPWTPGKKELRAIHEGGAAPIVLARFSAQEGSAPVESLLQWYEQNLSVLLRALTDNEMEK